jgi:hypothetical protein
LGGAPAEFNSFSDVPLIVKIDRYPPKSYGIPLPKNGNPLWPGDEVVFTFDESIQCEKPYSFGLSVTVESVVDGVTEKASVFGKDNLHVVCERNEIRFAFDYTNVGLDELMGNSITAVLTSVEDLVGNPYTSGVSDEIVNVFSHATVNETEAEVVIDIVLNSDCTTDHEGLRGDIAEFMYLEDQSRIQIQSIPACSTNGTKVFVTYKVKRSTDYGSSDRRLASTDMDLAPAPHVARKLIASLSDESPMRVRKIGIIIGESDQRRRAEDLIKQKAALDSTKLDSSNELVFEQLRLIHQKLEEHRLKLEEDRITDRSKLEEDRMTDRLKLEEYRMTDRSKLEEDRLKLEKDRMTDRLKQEEDRLKLEEDRETDRSKQEEDREMIKSVMQMLQQKQSSGMKQEEVPHNSVLFPMLACLLGVFATCLVIWTVGKGRKEKQDVEASIL